MTGKELKALAAQIQDEAVIEHHLADETDTQRYWSPMQVHQLRGVIRPILADDQGAGA